MTVDLIKNFNFPHNNPSRKEISMLHSGLQKLGFVISPIEIQRGELGDATKIAIKEYQSDAGLQATGELSVDTIKQFRKDLEHRFYANNKTRIEKIHKMLGSIGIDVDIHERNKRMYGKNTEGAIKEFQRKLGLKTDGILNEGLINSLKDEEVKTRFTTKTQIGKLQRLLLKVARISKIKVDIDAEELKEKKIGPTTKSLISKLKTKYGLKQSGKIDNATYTKFLSIAASRPTPANTLKVKSSANLSRLSRSLRLNMVNKDVGELQKIFAFLGYKIDEKEFNTKTFGKTTQKAVLEYQRSYLLPLTGHVDGKTLKNINGYVNKATPASTKAYPFRIKGSIRDDLWKGKANVKVQIWEKIIRGEGNLIAERLSMPNGFFDIPYDPPRNLENGQIKKPCHLQIKIVDQLTNKELAKKVLFNPTMINWVNFTDGKEPYRGLSEYEKRMKVVTGVLNDVPIYDIQETEQTQEITHVALNSDLSQEDIMRLALSHRVARKINNQDISPEVCYAFIKQNLPPVIPCDLLASTQEWSEIENLVDTVANALVFMEEHLKSEALNNSISENIIPIYVAKEKDQIMTTFSSVKQNFILEKPILTGNGTLNSLLQVSELNPEYYNIIANTFIKHGCTNSDFWNDVKSRPMEFGGLEIVKDLEVTMNLGAISKNHIATVSLLKHKINDPNDSSMNKVSDIAKLSGEQIETIIQDNGGNVPSWIEGSTNEEKIKNYADVLVNQSETLFPSVAFVSAIGRSNKHSLKKIVDIGSLLDANEDLDLRKTNLDKFVKEKNLQVPKDLLSEAKILQRVHRITPSASVGKLLIDEKIHHSSGVISMGKENFVNLIESNGMDRKTALTVYSTAEFQYAEILARIGEYRFELNRLNPKAITNYSFTKEEQEEFIELIPDWETLFGSLDFCDCPHCQSVYSPSAYVADVLNFLEHHKSEKANKSVKDILFERRPDIGNIKLNCDNSDTPLPYVDLVCEILENAIPSLPPNSDFSFQTTKSREELLAFPENVRKEAYNMLKNANYPMNTSLNLWQEESRIFLNHLGIPRSELMEVFQHKPTGPGANSPSDSSIAGEFWTMSSHEADIIITVANSTPQQDEYWGFDCTRDKITVSEFLQHTKIEYSNLLELLDVKWLNPSGAPDNIIIETSSEMCNTEKQFLINLAVDRYDKIHRFLRVWRHVPDWKIWELDLLIRCSKIGNGKIDSDFLVHLKQFKQVETKLGLSFEPALSLFHQINTEIRFKPDEPYKDIPPLYSKLFQNPAIINPVNEKFALPLSGTELLSDHKSTLMAALTIKEDELVLLLSKTDDKLNLSNLTIIYNYTLLATRLKISIEELFILQNLSQITDIFASPKDTLDLIEIVDMIKSSGFQIQELDYLVNFRPDSSFGIREEVITQYVQTLREILRNSNLETKEGQIISQIATTFSITEEQSKLLSENIVLQGQRILQHLKDERLTEKNDTNEEYTIEITPGNFPNIYDSFLLLHKATMLTKRLKIESQDLEWVLKKYGTFKSLDFSSLPIHGNPILPVFSAWQVLTKWMYFKSRYPEPESSSFREIFDIASNPSSTMDDILTAINKLTQWKVEDLKSLHTGWALQQAPNSDYLKVDTYIRLLKAFKLIKLIGVSASKLLSWSKRDDDTNQKQFITSQEVKEATKSKYDYSVWLSKVIPLQDELREKKRTALTNYLMEQSIRIEPKEITFNAKNYTNCKYWNSPQDLLGYFLIDVEMSACQPTSRIKQAISSIQMFVQRSFLNLEQPYVEVSRENDNASLNSWKQWKWMKNYRIWEANRKVFLYPENWIEPELRDDKSQFFIELENEILQKEITGENVEASFLHYLQKVMDVSRLDIAGVYHELDDDNPYDNLPPATNVVHVLGRTKSQSPAYYYRQFDLNYKTWSAWEKVELDIVSDHVSPVVYNRKLYLFWLVFVEKTPKVRKQPGVQPQENPSDIPEPPKNLEIQLAWSIRKDGGWTPKKVSRHKLVHPWQRPPSSYNLKTRYKSRENLLWLDIYISTSIDFNNAYFYDPYSDEPRRLTAVTYGENIRPWHSSSFVFDGDVVDIKLKPLVGQYHVLDGSGYYSDQLASTTSHQYIHDSFGEDGRKINRLEGGYEIAPRLILPDGMHYNNTHLTNNTFTLNNRLNVLESSVTKTLLDAGQPPFELVFSQDNIVFDTATLSPFFYQDSTRHFFIKPEWRDLFVGCNQPTRYLKYVIYTFYHPYAALFVRELNRSGLEGLLNRKIQLNPQDFFPGNSFNFTSTYRPKSPTIPDDTTERDIVDFSPYGAFSIYNWETFFHIPFMIACKLSQNQRFEEAMRWFHFIFDPTNTQSLGVPQKYWITKPFFEQNREDYRRQRIENLLENIDKNIDQVRAWKNNPFKPHLIARYRPVAYQKAVVMKYIDNLIAWGDQLFRRDTMESINEATLLYVLAYELLGPRPVRTLNPRHQDFSFNELTAQGDLDPFGNKKVEVLMENLIPIPGLVTRTDERSEPLPNLDIFYFCIPNNDNLFQYWNKVEDRLFKIRHCMNIEGVKRILPLFEPPIDPMLLVKAAAAGVDLSSVLGDTFSSQGQYRYRVLVQKAIDFCNEVKNIGDKLLSVLEKRDAEELAILRSSDEIELLEAVRKVREDQVNEALETWNSMLLGIDLLDKKIEYYDSIPRMNTWEIAGTGVHALGIVSEIVSTILNTAGGAAHLVPKVEGGVAGAGGSPTATVGYGGDNVGKSATNFAAMFQGIASILHQTGQMLEAQAVYERRDEENDFQIEFTRKEKDQLNKQIEASRIRHAITEKERDNTDMQIEHSKSIDEYMHAKYTNEQLYDWMLKQLATVYFQSYQLAYDMAKRAEKNMRFELGISDTSFIQFGYWDGLKKGLLAGEKLINDIHRMEAFYYEENKRELEITKHVSLAKFMPLALIMLKETGNCTIVLPEWLYDMDYPGHYRRKIKSVSITVPCIVGPYTSVNCTLSLTNNGIRISDDVPDGYGDPLTTTDGDRFVRNQVPVSSIATSHGQNDSGMFEINFNDDRYLPFEGGGAVSEWQISLPKENNQFDFATISDVILHVQYTAIAGGVPLTNAAKSNLDEVLPNSGIVFLALKNDFSNDWYRFLNPPDTNNDQLFSFSLKKEHLPFYAISRSINKNLILSKMHLILDTFHDGTFDSTVQFPENSTSSNEFLAKDTNFGNMPHLEKSSIPPMTKVLGDWKIKLKKSTDTEFKNLKSGDINNAYLVLGFNIQ